ncbi:ABC-2 family transporter protein [Natranaerofaba carboxydovora]|nr:ABC-2 family transporter protein [Natranaerofaba carboxydovora]
MAIEHLGVIFTQVLQQYRGEQLGLDEGEVSYLTGSVELTTTDLEADNDETVDGGFLMGENLVPLFFGILLFVLIMMTCSMLLQSALQEKQNKMSEIILSSAKPYQFMCGKIIGDFLLGIFQMGVWILLALPIVIYFTDWPVLEMILGVNIPLILFFGLSGYLFYAAIFVGLGATMEDMGSANNFQGVAMALPALSLIIMGPVMSDPTGTVATGASLFPFTSPIITIMRMGITEIPLWELLLSGILLIISIVLVMSIAAKLFRVGMLMYGKNATIPEIIKWIRYN